MRNRLICYLTVICFLALSPLAGTAKSADKAKKSAKSTAKAQASEKNKKIKAPAKTTHATKTKKKKAQPKTDPKATRPAPDEADFFVNLTMKKLVTFEDGCRGLRTIQTGAYPTETFNKLLTEMKKDKTARKGWKATPDKPLTFGRCAYMLCRMLKIRGGITMIVFGTSERYGLRECVHLHLMPTGAGNHHLTGADFLAILSRAQAYKETGNALLQ